MSRMIRHSAVLVKPTRRTPRPSTRFGAGISPYVPFDGRKPYTAQDVVDAVAMFADESEPDWDAMSQEAEHQVRHESLAPAIFGVCLNCNKTFDHLEPNGLCPRCDVHASETSTGHRA